MRELSRWTHVLWRHEHYQGNVCRLKRHRKTESRAKQKYWITSCLLTICQQPFSVPHLPSFLPTLSSALRELLRYCLSPMVPGKHCTGIPAIEPQQINKERCHHTGRLPSTGEGQFGIG